MRREQAGMSLISFALVLALAGFAAYVGTKLYPIYKEFYAVRTAMKSLAADAGRADIDPARAQALFFRRLYVDYSENVTKDDIQFERIDGGWRMRIVYEVRRPLLGNLDVVGKFDNIQDLTRRGVE